MLKMQSAKPPLLIVMLLLGISSASCTTAPTVSGCSELARSVLTMATPHAVIGNTGDPALDWQLYGVAETGQTNKANDDKTTGFAIINGCEKRDAEIIAKLTRPWWKFW